MKNRAEWGLTLFLIIIALYLLPSLIDWAGNQLALIGAALLQEVQRVALPVLSGVGAVGAIWWVVEHHFGQDHAKRTLKKVLPGAALVWAIPTGVGLLATGLGATIANDAGTWLQRIVAGISL